MKNYRSRIADAILRDNLDACGLWDAARFEVDHRDESTGQFIFTGSTVVKEKDKEKMKHSGTGRVGRMKMRPMSLFESGESIGSVSIGDLFNGKVQDVYKTTEYDIRSLAFLICRGGWPAALSMTPKVYFCNLHKCNFCIFAKNIINGIAVSIWQTCHAR